MSEPKPVARTTTPFDRSGAADPGDGSSATSAEPLVADPELAARVRAGEGPAFLVIGAAKSGTTSLWSYLQQHPQVFLPDVKEPNYFAFGAAGPPLTGPVPREALAKKLYQRTVTDPYDYLDLFAPAPTGSIAGEASVRYLYCQGAADRIAGALPHVRLVVVLRNPVDRLVSHYEMNLAAGLEPLSLADAVAAEDARVASGWGWDWHYVRVGRYADQLIRYGSFLDSGRLLVLEYSSFRDDPATTYAQVCGHIGVEPTFVPDMSRRSKETYRPRSRVLDRLITDSSAARHLRRVAGPRARRALGIRMRGLNQAARVTVDPGLRALLAERFRDDVDRLEARTGRAFPSLREPS